MSDKKICIFEGIPTGFSLEITYRDIDARIDKKVLIHGLSKEEALDRRIVLEVMKDASLPFVEPSSLIPLIILELERKEAISKLSTETQYIINIAPSYDRLVWFLEMFEISHTYFVLPVLEVLVCEVKTAIPKIELETI